MKTIIANQMNDSESNGINAIAIQMLSSLHRCICKQ